MSADIGVWRLDWEKFLEVHTDSDSTESVFGNFVEEELPFLIAIETGFEPSNITAQEAGSWLGPDENVSETTQTGLDAIGSLFDEENEAERFVGFELKGETTNLTGVFSPAHVKEMAEKVSNTRWVEFSSAVVKASKDEEWLDDFEGVTDLEHYLRQWARIIEEAAASGHGLITMVR
jgi:hypothetical protein